MKKTFYICDGCGIRIQDNDVVHATLTTNDTYNKSADLCPDCNLKLVKSWAKAVGDNQMLRAIDKLKFSV